MTIEHIPAESRGRPDFGWLQSRHSFSFGNQGLLTLRQSPL